MKTLASARRRTLPVLAFAALVALAGAFAVTAGNGGAEPAPQENKLGPDDLPLKPPPDPPFDSAAYQTAVAAGKTEAPRRALAVAEEYNSGRLDYRTLPLSVADIFTDPSYPPREVALETAEFVARVRVEGVRFLTEGMGLPSKDVTFRLVGKPFAGTAPGERFELGLPGGPKRGPDGVDRYVVLPLQEPELPGEEYVVFVRRQGSLLVLATPTAMLRIDGDRIADTAAAREWKVVGKRAADVTK